MIGGIERHWKRGWRGHFLANGPPGDWGEWEHSVEGALDLVAAGTGIGWATMAASAAFMSEAEAPVNQQGSSKLTATMIQVVRQQHVQIQH